jgi:hypothetical protein
MAAFAELNGLPITSMHLVVPALGIWHADVSLGGSADPTGPQTLTLAGSTWLGTVFRSVTLAGEDKLRLVGGAGGWRKAIPAQQYQSQVGVPTSTVLSDAASLVGELPPVLAPTIPFSLGNAFVRQAGAASLVLQQIVGDAWWMDLSGVVQTAARPTTAITSSFVVESSQGGAGWYRIATESPGDWQPGATFSGPTASGSVSRVEHRISGLKLWTEVLIP